MPIDRFDDLDCDVAPFQTWACARCGFIGMTLLQFQCHPCPKREKELPNRQR